MAQGVWNGAMRVKLALSTLCENPDRRTGLSTLFPELVLNARTIFPDVGWIVFAGRDGFEAQGDPGVEVCRDFPSNERPWARLLADHFRVGAEARRRGAAALVTVGFQPVRPSGLPVVMQVFAVGEPGQAGARAAYRRWALGRGLERASLVITNSAWASSMLGTSEAPVIVSPEGIRHDRFTPKGPWGDGRDSGRYFLWASNFYPYKRVGLALRAYAGLPGELRSEFPFVLVGGDWEGGLALAVAEARRLGIEKDVSFRGWVADDALPGLYRGAVAHVLSTSRETFGRSVLEAMACGCPSVLQDLLVLREVAGECAQYVDFEDTAAATGALRAVCSDPGLRASLVERGIARAGEFSFERLARERVGAILNVLESGSP